MQIYDEPGKGYNVFDYLNEIQRIQFATTPLAGYWKASFIGQQTGELAYDIDAATLQSALEALSTIGVGNVSVTGDITTYFEVEFINVLQGINVPMIYLDTTHIV
jgi:trimeric autotransporter adhesin